MDSRNIKQKIEEEKEIKFNNDLKNEDSLIKTVSNFCSKELNETLCEILILSRLQFFTNIESNVIRSLEDLYSENCTNNKKLTSILNNNLKLLEKKYDENYTILSKAWNNYNNKTVEKKYLTNFRKHCFKTGDFALHNCQQNENKFLIVCENEKNDSIKFVICENCKKVYLSSFILCKCFNCDEDFYSSILNKNEKSDFLPATWKKYHCPLIINNKMRCIKCRDFFNLNLNTGMLCCVNKKCGFTSLPKKILWNCKICSQDFTSEAIVYNPLEFEIVQKIVDQTLTLKHRAHPNKIPCCKLNVYFTEFYHKKNCKGILYLGELNDKLIVVCEKCEAINFYENFIWTCPNCNLKFRDKSYLEGEKKNNNNNIKKNKSINNSRKKIKEDKGIESYKEKNKEIENMEKIEKIFNMPKFINSNSSRKKSNSFKGSSAFHKLSMNEFEVPKLEEKGNDENILKDKKEKEKEGSNRFYKKIIGRKILGNDANNNKNSDSNKPFLTIQNEEVENKENKDIKKRRESKNENYNNILVRRKFLGDFSRNINTTEIESKSDQRKSGMFLKFVRRQKLVEGEENNEKKEEKKNELSFNEKGRVLKWRSKHRNLIISTKDNNNENNANNGNKENNENNENNENKENNESDANKIKQEKRERTLSFNSESRNGKRRYLFNPKVVNSESKNEDKNVQKTLSSKDNSKLSPKFKRKLRQLREKNKTENEVNNNDNADNRNLENIEEDNLKYKNEEENEDKNEDKNDDKNDDKKNLTKGKLIDEKNEQPNKRIQVQKRTLMNNNLMSNVNKKIDNILLKAKIKRFDINDYSVDKKLGEGSCGVIYRITNKKTNKKFAFKKNIKNNLTSIELCIKEFDMVSLCHHPNIMEVYGINIRLLDTTTYCLDILMEVAERDWDKEIRKHLRERTYYTEEELINILKQISSALLYIQQTFNVTHRDIKPQNVLVFTNNIYKLADFGEAKEVKINKQVNTLRGTELYMSPILLEGLKLNKDDVKHDPFKSDVFSLGFCLIYAAGLNYQLLYDLREFNNDKSIANRLKKQLKKLYSEKFIDLICQMVKLDEKERLDFVGLNNELKKW